MTFISLTTKIKEFALDLGYSKVGIAAAETFPEYIKEVKSRGKTYDFLWQDPSSPMLGSKIFEIMPSAKSIIVLILDYAKNAFPKSLTDKIGRIYQARCYKAPSYRINGARFQLFINFLMKKGFKVNPDINIPARWMASKSGISTFGKNTFSYAGGIGSFIVLNTIVIDEELEYDKPTMECRCPPGCTACIDKCPTQAIYEPFKLNPLRCLAFNAWKTQEDQAFKVSAYIPHDIREKMGTHIHGCDICQEVCPFNQEKIKAKLPKDEFLFEISKDFSLAKMLNISDDFYKSKVEPIMYNYIKDYKYFQRNAAIAIGNTGDSSFIPDLETAMENPEELVRAHAAWALGKIGGSLAKQILEISYSNEKSEKVKNEIELALIRMKNCSNLDTQ